jgi:uncharacterized protein (DUF1810 family)
MDKSKSSLDRFIMAQQRDYQAALEEVRNGRKRSHWMWYIFPQIQGLGYSETSRYYGITDLQEATAYLNHPVLGQRLIDICKQLLKLEDTNASQVFGSPDDLKLKSSMTLFAAINGADPVFEAVLGKFFAGSKDMQTLRIMQKS